MYDGYEPLDEMERRNRRDEIAAPYNFGGPQDPGRRAPANPWKPEHDVIGLPQPTEPPKPTREATSIDHEHPLPPPSPTPAPAPAVGGGQPTFEPPAAPPAPAPQVQKNPVTDEVTKILMSKLNELKTPGDLNSDPHYQQAVRAYQIGQLRSQQQQRSALAERAAASGTRASGGFNVGVRGIAERAGENAAQYRSGLAMDRLRDRESQLIEAIKLARAVGQDEIANQLELQRLSLQSELGRGDLALRSELGRGQLNLGYDNLGFSYADLISRANRDAVIAGLRG